MTPEIVVFGEPEARVVDQLKRCMEHAVAGVICADAHPGYSMPIGGVVAYPEHVSPSGVGFDIGCGNKAVLTDLMAGDVPVSAMMDEIVRRISFGVGRVNNEPADHAVLDDIRDAEYRWQAGLLDLAASQLGTVGAGNHYVDLFDDEEGRLWVGVHFGSRGFGHKTATHFNELAGARDDMDAEPALLDVGTGIGEDYVEAMVLAGSYAHAGRDLVCDKVLDILGARSLDSVHNHHNYAWRETHHGVESWVVRKGSTPAFPGQRGFVGASMGEDAVILEGVESDLSAAALHSTVHGAGRAMSRSQAAGKVKRRTVWSCRNRDCAGWLPASAPEPRVCPVCGGGAFNRWQTREVVSMGLIDWDATLADLGARGIELRGGAADEAPGAYKRLANVLAAHEGTVRIVHRLRPVGVAMAGPDTVDP